MLLADGGSGGVTPVTTFTPLTFNPPFNPARTTSSNEFLARADRALYAAKNAGKNQVRAAS